MLRTKRTFRATDAEYDAIQEYARVKGRTVSAFVLHSALSEISKHPPKNGLESLVRQIIQEELKNRFPTRGNQSDKVLSGKE